MAPYITSMSFSVLIVFFYPYTIVAYNSWLDHVLGWWKQTRQVVEGLGLRGLPVENELLAKTLA